MFHRVVASDEGQYSTWPDQQELPPGWKATGFTGSEEECLDHIAQEWTGLSPQPPAGAAGPGTNVIGTSRLVLRELTTGEVAGVLDLLADGRESAECVPGYPLAGTGFAARHFTERTPDELRFGFGMYYLVRRPDGLAIGDIGFHRPPKDGVVEIGFGLAESARGQGYATEAATELARWALAQPGVSQVITRTDPDNVGSQGVLTRSGFRHERTENDELHYVLAPESLPRPASAPGFAASEPMRDDEAERAAIKKLGEIRKAGGDDLEFVPGSGPLRRVVRDGKRPLAYAQSGDKAGVADPHNFLIYIVVHPVAARRGLASGLLAEIRDDARAHGKKGLVTGTPDADAPLVAWMRRHGFTPIGHHLGTRRERGAQTAAAPAGLEVTVVNRADTVAAEEFVTLAAATVAEAVMPGGARMTDDASDIRKDLVEGGDGPLLVCRTAGRPLGWAALTPLAADGDAGVIALQVLAEAVGRGVPATLLASAASLADADSRRRQPLRGRRGGRPAGVRRRAGGLRVPHGQRAHDLARRRRSRAGGRVTVPQLPASPFRAPR